MENTMLAAVFEGEGKLTLKQVPIPKVEKGSDVIVKVKAASICGSDVRILAVPPEHPANLNTILGHEFSAEVVGVGDDVTNVKVGDFVVVAPNIRCGTCRYCRIGHANMCENFTTIGVYIDGAFAEYVKAPAEAVYKISDEVSPEQAVFVEPLSCIVNAANKARVLPGETVVVLGAGPIGLQFTQLVKASGARKLIVSEISAYRRDFAHRSGATVVVDPTAEDLEEIVRRETDLGADVVIDAVGTLLKSALKLVRKGGRIVLFGVNEGFSDEIRPFEITHNDVIVIGSFIDNLTFLPAIRIVEGRILDLETLITHRFPLSEIHRGIQLMREGKCVKTIILP